MIGLVYVEAHSATRSPAVFNMGHEALSGNGTEEEIVYAGGSGEVGRYSFRRFCN